MNLINIYLSLQEVEDLTFKRLLRFGRSRLDVSQAKGLLSTNVLVNKDELIEDDCGLVLLFSSVTKFEIPEKDVVVFQNHYRIPQGLLKLNKRNSRDIIQGDSKIDFKVEWDNILGFLKLRNGFLGTLDYAYRYNTNVRIVSAAEKLFNGFFNLSKFKSNFISEISRKDFFPILEVNLGKFVSEHVYRITWWGRFIKVNLLAADDESSSKLIREWLKFFVNKRSTKEINDHLVNIPLGIKDEIEFLLGYYFAAYHFEYLRDEENSSEGLFNDLKCENKEELFLWLIFFKSFFNDKINSLYFINSLNKEVYQLEKLAFEIMRSDLQPVLERDFKFELKTVEKKDLVADYLKLNYGGENLDTEIIIPETAVSRFKNKLNIDSLSAIGLERFDEKIFEAIFPNLSWIANDKFHLTLCKDIDGSLITFYLRENAPVHDTLKAFKIKIKSSSTLIDKNKKVLIAFFKNDREPKLFNLYTGLLKKELETRFEKIVVILLINQNTENVHSIEFNNSIKQIENQIRSQINIKVEIIVKNETNLDDSEIKRNLRNTLKKYKINQLEVVDGNFDMIKASWLLEINSEYFIFDENVNYYCFYNKD